jgi:hypothetical protein
MISIEDVQLYLPKYLTPDSEKALFEELKNFPQNIDGRLYTSRLKNELTIFQGDGIKELLVVNLPDTNVNPSPTMILSNTCDIDPNNQRLFKSRLVYAPIFNLKKYHNMLLTASSRDQAAIDQHVESIKRQRITQVFYLPKGGQLTNDSMVFLDRINNCDNSYISRDRIKELRLFTLSDYGLYLFLFKLSIHFTRIAEKIDRGIPPEHVPN